MAPKNTSVKKVSFPLSKLKKAAVTYPVDRIQGNQRKCNLSDRISTGGAIYFLAGVLEYLTAEVLELAGDLAKASKMHQINPRHIMATINNNSELDKLVENIEIPYGIVSIEQHAEQLQKIYKGNNHAQEESNQSEEMEVQSGEI